MKPVITLILVLFIISVSCEIIQKEKEADDNLKENSSITFKTGRICGWCGGTDSLVIQKNNMYYQKVFTCEDSIITRSIPTDKEIWNKLKSLLDYDTFVSLEHSSCAVCVDGCDTWIQIENDTQSHYIRYESLKYDDVKPVKDFAKVLDSVLIDFKDL